MPVTVLGAGSWGTALAIRLAANGHQVRLWGRNAEHMAALSRERENREYLAGCPFPESLQVQPDLAAALTGARDVLVVVPSHAFREMLRQMTSVWPSGARLAWATKGLELDSGKMTHQVAAEELGDNVPKAVVSGPTFAMEVGKGLPAGVTVASADAAWAHDLATLLHGGDFRAYTSTDIVGVEVGGAVKNVMAIATGVADGLGLGANTRAALITRGLMEMMRLGAALGGQRDTLMGLAGLGDLVLTCTDDQSRNRRMGLALGEGLSMEQARQRIRQVVEGVYAADAVWRVAQRLDVEMPITRQVYNVLYQGVAPAEAVAALRSASPKPELE